jgi:site-specific DNA recombinase
MKPGRPILKRRCASYTWKFSEEGLGMAFNSLDVQRRACDAYMASQKARAGCWFPAATTTAASRAVR